MGGIKHDPPSDEGGTMARGDCCLHALVNPALAGEAGATVVAAAAEGATGWWQKWGVCWFVVQWVAASKQLGTA